MIEFSLLRWIQTPSITSFVIFIKSQVKKKKALRELQHTHTAGPGECFMIIKDPCDYRNQQQISNTYYKAIYKS